MMAASGQVSLTPDGPPVDRSLIEDDLRDCLRQLRRVRLERAALQSRPDISKTSVDAGGTTRDDEVRSSLAECDRQEAMLAEERDRLATALADGAQEPIDQRRDRAELDRLLALRRRVGDRLERLRFEQLVLNPITVISEARPTSR